jgi:hypothetical protein
MSDSTKTMVSLEDQIAALTEANAKLAENLAAAKTAKARSLTIKVSQKGGASVYGLGRWPVTLYKTQWRQLLAIVPQIEEFLEKHDAELKDKE